MTHPCLPAAASALARRGFSMLELSVVLAIIGVMVAGGLTLGASMVEDRANISTSAKLDEINKAIKDFALTQGRLPCVASKTAALGSATFGVEITPGSATCSTNTTVPTGTARIDPIPAGGTDIVRIGGVPTRALGLKDNMATDEFGNRFLYAVTESLTSTAGFTNSTNLGAITVRDGAGNAIATANGSTGGTFVVLSHGPDGKGAIRNLTATATATACGAVTPGNPLDNENCNDDQLFRAARFNNGAVAGSFFDDFVRYTPKYNLIAGAAAVGTPNLWQASGQNSFHIGTDGDATTGNIGVGTNNPPSRISVVSAGTNSWDNDVAIFSYGAIPANNNPRFITLRARGTEAAPTAVQTGDILGTYQFSGHTGAGWVTGGTTQGIAEGNWSTVATTQDAAMTFATTLDGTTAEKMRITSGGNVGIGTTTPTTLLSIGPNPLAALGVGELLQLGRATDAFLTVNDGTARGIFGSSSGLPFAGSQSNHDFVLRSNNLERMRITTTGNVGIGTTAPASRLTVLGEGAGIAQLGGTGCGGDFAGLTLGQTAAPTCNTYHIASSASPVAPETVAGTLFINRPAGVSVRFRENNVDQMIITSGGNVGIGYTAPVATLDVNGSIASDQFTIPSDARLKHNIHPVFAGEGLKILAGLQPVSFVWNKNNKPDIGLIAQQVEKALPQAVEKTDNGMLRVTYDKLILPLIAAIQELHEMLKKLASQITAMAERQSALEKRLTALEAENAALREEVTTLKAGGKN